MHRLSAVRIPNDSPDFYLPDTRVLIFANVERCVDSGDLVGQLNQQARVIATSP